MGDIVKNSLGLGDATAFANTPDPAHFFRGARRGTLIDTLQSCLLDNDAVLLVLGEPGSGKTSICRRVAQELSTPCQIVYLSHPNLTPEPLLRAIAAELGLAAAARDDKLDVLRGIQEHALAQYAQDRRVVLLVDDAQLMGDESLEELRLLINWEGSERGLIQMVLFAQPDFEGRLRSRSLRALEDRISCRFVLRRFSLWETRRYLDARLNVSANASSAWNFTAAATVTLYCLSRGRPRRITRLARHAWECAYKQATTRIHTKHVVSGFLRAREFHSAKVRPPFAYAFLGSLLAAASFASGAWLPSPALPEHVGASTSSGALTSVLDKQEDAMPALRAEPPATEAARIADVAPPVAAAGDATNDTLSPLHPAAVGASNYDTHAAGHAWLARADQRAYTIQLVFCWDDRSDHRMARDTLLAQARAMQTADDVALLSTTIRDRPASIVTFGHFDTKAQALEALAALPPELSEFKPFVRRVARLQREILGATPHSGSSEKVVQR